MKIKVISDQHFEFRTEESTRRQYLDVFHPQESSPEADVCVIAGDIDIIRGETVRRFQEICDRENLVLYVPGNHDYYNQSSDVENIDAALATIEGFIPNLKILRTGQPFFHSGRRFLGDTMWVRECVAMIMSRHCINDNSIRGFWQYMPGKNAAFEEWLRNELTSEDIVVTHHLPSENSTPPFFRRPPNNNLQPWFVCDQEGLIAERQPKLWIHGHTHTRCDYYLGGTRIFCNPLGYPHERKTYGGALPCIVEV